MKTLISSSLSLVFFLFVYVGLLVITILPLYVFDTLWLKPQRLRKKLEMQGIRGPKPSFPYGNVSEMQKIQCDAMVMRAPRLRNRDFVGDDYTCLLFPHFEQWRRQYGSIYTYSTGNKQHLYISDPELIKEMNLSINQTKIMVNMDKVNVHQSQGVARLTLESTNLLLKKWQACIEAQGNEKAEIRVDEYLWSVSADVISKACFGSSCNKGNEIFSKLRTLHKAKSSKGMLFGIPTYGKRINVKSLEKEIDVLVWEVVCERKCELETTLLKEGLLQRILEEALDRFVSEDERKRFVVDNFKDIYFAGHESTSVAASWCLMLLALYPQWQMHIRDEVHEACPNGSLDLDSLSKLKSVMMVIQEAIRLFPPTTFVSREALERTQIGHIVVPKGVCMCTLIPKLHRNPDIWGQDAHKFRPERFINGVCNTPHAYIPFGVGSRSCIGQNFAMAQLKVIVSLITCKFNFSLSPNYQHAPAYRMIVQPGHGVNILIQNIQHK